MKNKKVTVRAVAKAKEGMEETVRQELLSLVNPTKKIVRAIGRIA